MRSRATSRTQRKMLRGVKVFEILICYNGHWTATPRLPLRYLYLIQPLCLNFDRQMNPKLIEFRASQGIQKVSFLLHKLLFVITFLDVELAVRAILSPSLQCVRQVFHCLSLNWFCHHQNNSQEDLFSCLTRMILPGLPARFSTNSPEIDLAKLKAT